MGGGLKKRPWNICNVRDLSNWEKVGMKGKNPESEKRNERVWHRRSSATEPRWTILGPRGNDDSKNGLEGGHCSEFPDRRQPIILQGKKRRIGQKKKRGAKKKTAERTPPKVDHTYSRPIRQSCKPPEREGIKKKKTKEKTAGRPAPPL